jgi:hypothetical protein
MEVKRIEDKLQAMLDPVEVLRMTSHENVKIGDSIRASVWRMLQVHALSYLNGMKIGWSALDFVNGKFIVTFGPASFRPDAIQIPEAKNGN